jgi:hypothetical protein
MNNQQNDESALEKWERQKAEGQPIAEHILNIIKAVLSAAPFTGAIASLITDYIPVYKTKRLEEFAEQIAKDLLQVQDSVNSEYLKTDDFAFMFEQSFRAVAEYPQKEKIEAFRGILVNSATSKVYTEEEKEYFLNLAMNLTSLHIRILKFMAMPEKYLDDANIPTEKIIGGFSEFFPAAIPGVTLEVIRSAFSELNRYGFINTPESIFATMTSGQGLNLLRGRVTELGNRFITFCTSPVP